MTLQEEVKIRGDVDDEKRGIERPFKSIAMQWFFLFALIIWAVGNVLLYEGRLVLTKTNRRMRLKGARNEPRLAVPLVVTVGLAIP